MSEYPLTLMEITSWVHKKGLSSHKAGVDLAKVCERDFQKPAVIADFDAAQAIGRINAWASGEIDFEVLRREDGKDVLFRHVDISRIDEPILEEAYADFLRVMLNPETTIETGLRQILN